MLFLTILVVNNGFFAAQQEGRPSFFGQIFWIVLTEMVDQPMTSFFSSVAVLNVYCKM
jgi:hypothetical protein